MPGPRIAEYLGDDFLRVRETIASSLSSDIPLLNTVNQSILSHSGKFLRPALCLLAGRICSGGTVNGDTVSFAAASELLHNATLLHDDVVDDSSERRGLPTTRHLLGPTASVLIGDFWLVKAMDRIMSAERPSGQVIRLFSKTLSDLAEGEMLQLQKSGTGDTDRKDYFRIIYNKTASLFETAMVAGAMSVDAPECRLDDIREYASHLGLAFQIQDDILDYEGNRAALGKPVGQDLREHKITLPLLCALESCPADEETEIRHQLAAIGCEAASGQGDKNEDSGTYTEMENAPANQCESIESQIDRIFGFVKEYDGIGNARRQLAGQIDMACKALDEFPESGDKSMMIDIARFVASRDS